MVLDSRLRGNDGMGVGTMEWEWERQGESGMAGKVGMAGEFKKYKPKLY